MRTFFETLKDRIVTNYQRHGGLVGLFGVLAVICALIIPPFIALEALDIAPFTPMRLVVPLIWIIYLLPGTKKLEAQLRPISAVSLILWPLLKA